MTWGADIRPRVINHIYEAPGMVKAKVGEADRVMSAGAPRMRDLPQTTGAGLSKKSNDDRAIVNLYSDPKDPDVFETAGNTKPGRPKKARNGTRSATGPYRGGVDLANITNGLRAGGTTRRTPLRTHGWWDKTVKRACQVFMS